MLNNIRNNTMGTVSFDGKFDGMRKFQDFIVYPMQAGDDVSKLLVQSGTRIGYIYLDDGRVFMSPSVASGAYSVHLMKGKFLSSLSAEELLLLKTHMMASASPKAGTNGVIYCDNSQAVEVFGNNGGSPATM
jgi:hypothetical protein